MPDTKTVLSIAHYTHEGIYWKQEIVTLGYVHSHGVIINVYVISVEFCGLGILNKTQYRA
ncbi:hypothetical protein DXN04_19965 [Chitinophaga silvisoli]|uniref:Uncharacterized protein n=1 Tax=Chitinophaga silvisoli TaxID=2291814 RepID=A0A3E1NZE8_9BACT|nr:hypothetical protein DXN04_19965 [Chitinophaga silvisoli]